MFHSALFLFFLFQNYKVFPEISYINIKNIDIVLIQYRKNTIAVTAGNINVNDLKVPVKIDRVFQVSTGDSTINLTDRYVIRLISRGNKLEAEVCFLEKSLEKPTMAVFDDKIASKDTGKEIIPYKHIVKLKKDDTYTTAGTIINKYIIVGNKILKFSQGLEEIL